MEKKHWSFVGHVALGSFVIAPPLAPVLTSAAALVAVRHSAWEQSMALEFDNTQQSLLRILEAGIRKMGMKRYVPDKVMLVCSSGIKTAKLKVASQTTVTMASGRLVGTLPDKMDCNMMCAMLIVGGAIAGAIFAAAIVAAVALSGGTILIAGSALLGAAAVGAGGAVVGAGIGAALAAFIPCLCAMLTGPWIPVHPRMIVCGQPALIEDSKLTCFLGGTVSIFYSPEMAEMQAARNR